MSVVKVKIIQVTLPVAVSTGETELFCIGHQTLAVVVFSPFTATGAEFARIGLAVQNVHAVPTP